MVTKQQQLAWLAKKYKTWPEQGSLTLRLSAFEIGKFAVVNCHVITRKEWQQERDKMQKQDNKSECAVMTLSEAIDHANEKSRELEGNCAANHGLLAHWLTEYRDILSNLNQQNEQDNSWYEREELPPVGYECEAIRNGEWVAVEVLRHRVNNVEMNVAAVMDCTSFNVFWSDDFRPLCTEREKAINEMNELVGNIERYPTWGDAMAALYDAGYRKVASK